MKTNSSLAFMQAVATFSLLSSLGLAYVINPINDSLFFLALDGFVGAIYGNDVLTALNNSVVAGILLGLFIGTVYVFIGANKKVHDYAVLSVFVVISSIFVASIRKYDPVPYEVT
ncbi:MAG: hypothetical protein VX188_00145, partial [Candidatus Thermoplasmatota archaeon]|nr:hypothetical protein [Candidatus Thermoplasmatota archaeon]